MQKNKQKAYRWGHGAEFAAAWFLRCKGYRILARRFRAPVGEIDLVARRGAHYAFVEVKARGGDFTAGEVLRAGQAARVRRAAEAWLAQQTQRGALPADWSASLDLIVIQPWRLPQHVSDAF